MKYKIFYFFRKIYRAFKLWPRKFHFLKYNKFFEDGSFFNFSSSEGSFLKYKKNMRLESSISRNMRFFLILKLESSISWFIRNFLILEQESSISWNIRNFFRMDFFLFFYFFFYFFFELGLKSVPGRPIYNYYFFYIII